MPLLWTIFHGCDYVLRLQVLNLFILCWYSFATAATFSLCILVLLCPNRFLCLLPWLNFCPNSDVNSLRAKFFRWKINIYLQFMSSIRIDMTQVFKILPDVRPGPTYSTQSISWLLMSWRREEPGHQQPWYWPSYTEIFMVCHPYMCHSASMNWFKFNQPWWVIHGNSICTRNLLLENVMNPVGIISFNIWMFICHYYENEDVVGSVEGHIKVSVTH